MKQGKIWLLDLDPARGAEIQKKRPAIIVNDDALGILPLKIIVPVTDWKDRYQIAPWMVKIIPSTGNGLTKFSAADCFQVRSLSQERFIKRLGAIDDQNFIAIKNALIKIFSIKLLRKSRMHGVAFCDTFMMPFETTKKSAKLWIMEKFAWNIPYEEILLDEYYLDEYYKRKSSMGIIKFMFSDHKSGLLLPWPLEQPIEEIWEGRKNAINFCCNNENILKIGSIVFFRIKNDGNVDLKNMFFVYIYNNNLYIITEKKLHLLFINVENTANGLYTANIRWNYEHNFAMVKIIDTATKNKFPIVLKKIWHEILAGVYNQSELWEAIHSINKLFGTELNKIIFASLKEVFEKDLNQIIYLFRSLKNMNFSPDFWNWGGICINRITFARWVSEVDEYQPLIRSQKEVNVWKICLLSISRIEIEHVIKLLKKQSSSNKQIDSALKYLKQY